MPPAHALRLALLLSPLLAAGCASRTAAWTDQLNARLQQRLAPEIAARQVAVAKLPDGARVAFDPAALQQPGTAALSGTGEEELTRFVQALLDPGLLRIAVAEQPQPDGITGFLQQANLGNRLAAAPAAAPAPVITVQVVPPRREDWDDRQD